MPCAFLPVTPHDCQETSDVAKTHHTSHTHGGRVDSMAEQEKIIGDQVFVNFCICRYHHQLFCSNLFGISNFDNILLVPKTILMSASVKTIFD